MTRTTTLGKAAALVFLAALIGCATPAPYAPRGSGQQTGYTDRQLAANRWRVTFTGNSVTPREQVEDDLLLRAAEVTLAAGYSHFLFDTRDTQAQTRATAILPNISRGRSGAAAGAFVPAGVMTPSAPTWISPPPPATRLMPRSLS